MRHQSGFSLLELAIAIVILAAILGSVVVPVATQMQAKKIKETEQLLEDAKEALLGFALSNNGRLPCPNSVAPFDGLEDACPAAATVEGFLPWSTLGLPATDAWGRILHYGVTVEFTVLPNPATACGPGSGDLDLCDTGNINVRDTLAGIDLVGGGSPGAPAVVVSTGPNGLGGRDFVSGVTLPAGATNENNNSSAALTPTQFILRPYFDDAPAGCVDPACNFDDLVVWVSTPILFNRMVAAGRLP